MNDELIPSRGDRTAEEHTSADSQKTASELENRARSQVRVRRALDCMDQSLERDDPFEANLGAMAGNLMLFGAKLDEAIQDELTSERPTIERIQKVAPSIELGLKIARQIDRLAQLVRQSSRKK